MSIRRRLLYFVLYCLPVPWLTSRFMPRDGQSAKRSYLMAQSMGRNSLSDELLRPQLDRITKGSYTSTLMCFTRLSARGFDAGTSNLYLAAVVGRFMQRWPNLIAILQWEVAYALWERDKVAFMDLHPRIDCLWPPSNGYFGAVEVTAAAKLAIRERQLPYRNGLLLAHPDMIVRSLAIGWRQGLDLEPVYAKMPFDKASVQPWTRTQPRFVIHEFLARVHHVLYRRVRLTPPR